MLRNISNVPYDHPSEPLFKSLKLINVHSIYKYRLCVCYKSEVQKNHLNLIDLASLAPKVPTYPTRSLQNWKLPNIRTTYAEQMLSYTLPNLLNFLSSKNIDPVMLSRKDIRELFSSVVF